MAVADVYDALVSERVYKHSWTHQQALAAILAEKGKQFDPDVVQALLLEANTFEHIAQQLKD
jgi:putative two-component system response regulator